MSALQQNRHAVQTRLSHALATLATGVLALSGVASAAGDDPKPGGGPDLASFDATIKPSDREHWSFQPVQRPDVPAVHDTRWARNPIDAFVLAKLNEHGWKPAPPAEPRQLLRRVYLDVIGLPPSLAEQQAFLNAATSPDAANAALDRVIDELLARPQYGERWARHWLDLVRYAESNGYERDATKPHVWRYRDYVIQSFNADKPFDRFVIEQLAGDELPDATAETMIATGFYRLGPWDDEPADPKEDRFDQLDDIVSTTSQVFLGLTVGCARCHNHKFEPLTQHDYYRLVAVFNPLQRPQAGRTELDVPVGTRSELEHQAYRDRQLGELTKQLATNRDKIREQHLAGGASKLPPEAIAAFRTEPSKRNDEQKKLVAQHQKQLDDELAAALPDEAKQAIAALEMQIADLRQSTPDLPRGYVMHEPPNPPTTHLLIRGKATRPGPEVASGVPAVLVSDSRPLPAFAPPADARTSGRRLALARWIASPDNPLTARVIVNRVWQFHFGEGLVRSPSEFGRSAERPTHTELLDWLASEFVEGSGESGVGNRNEEIENRESRIACRGLPSVAQPSTLNAQRSSAWSLKRLHRLILQSNTYRMSKRSIAERADADPENRLLAHGHYRRLEVEAIRDSMLAASGQLNDKMFGPSMFPPVPPAALEGNSDPDKIWKASTEREASRRTIYAFVKRAMVIPMLEVLDLCDTARSSAKRQITTVAPQALALFNGDFVNQQARYFTARLVREAGDEPAAQINLAYRIALCRPPTDAERAALLAFLDREATSLERESAGTDSPLAPADARHRALEQLCRAIFNLNEFAYPD